MKGNGRIAVICPTLMERADSLSAMKDSVQGTANKADIFVYREPSGPRVGPVVGANTLVKDNPDFSAYVFLTDDCRVVTPGWDDFVLAAVDAAPGGVVVVSPFVDGLEHVNFPCLSRAWIDAVGYFAHPSAYHFCWDTIVEILAESTSIVYAGRNEFRVIHPSHTSVNVKEHFARDCQTFLFWAIGERRTTIKRIRQAMEAA